MYTYLVELLKSPDSATSLTVEQWKLLLSNARENKLLGPTAASVAALDAALVPDEVRDTLSTLSTERTLAALYMTRQLHAVLDLLASRGIAALTYKGIALAQLAFGSLSARETSDLDLLVDPRDFKRAYETLLDDGFRCDYPSPTRHMFRQSYEISLIHPERGINVDLHRAFLPACYPLKLDLSTVTPYSMKLLGREVPTLEPTEHFLVLCAHGSKHGWRELRWIYDLDQLSRRQTIDWVRLWRLAREHRAARAVGVGLELSRRLFDTPLPTSPISSELIKQTLLQVGGGVPSLAQRHRYQWSVADDWVSRVRYLLWTLFYPHQRDLDFVDLPTSLWPLYYVVRPFRTASERLT